MSSAPSIKATLNARNTAPKKSLGQNFLVDENVARQIVQAAHVSRETSVIEIGPGTGALTRHLVAAAGHVYAVELDPRMIEILRKSLQDTNAPTLIHADVLKVDFEEILQSDPRPYSVLGNLPYYITSHAIRKILETPRKPTCVVLMVQYEVARRMTAQPDEMSLLALGAQFYGKTEFLFHVKRGAFYPQPNVDSAVVRITPHDVMPDANADAMFAIAKAGFSQPRKQLRNTLASGLKLEREQTAEWLLRAKIDPARRPETLSVDDWVRLARLHKAVSMN